MTQTGKRTLLLALLIALVLAGCTDAGTGDGPGGDATPPAAMTAAEARSALAGAVQDMPEAFAMEMKALSAGTEVLTIKGSFDNRTGRSYIDLRGDPATLANLSRGEGAGAILGDGFAIYSTPEGSLYLANGTAFVFPPQNGSESQPAASASPEHGPLGGFLDPENTFSDLTDENVTVTSVRPLVYRGKPAVELTVQHPDGETTMTSEVTLFTEPRRLARIETDLPAEEGGENPLAGARLEGDFYYDNEVEVVIPESATRAIGLAYSSDRAPFSFGGEQDRTWTFLNSAGIALAEVEAQVKSTESQTDGDVASLPTVFAMRLSEGTKTQDGVTLTFTDVDGDGKVSKGDTLKAEASEDESLPTVVLYDTKTETYVVPGPGLVATLALAGLAGLLLRRRG